MNIIYMNEKDSTIDSNKLNVAMYMRVGNIEQLDFYIEEKIKNKLQNKVAAIYIRTNCNDDKGIRYNIDLQRKLLEDYCKQNHIENIVEYIDIGKSANTKDRKAFQQMIDDIKNKKINIIIVKDITRLFRNPIEAKAFLEENFMIDVETKSLDNSIEELRKCDKTFWNNVLKDIDMVEDREL